MGHLSLEPLGRGLVLASLLALACGSSGDSGEATGATTGPPVGEFHLVDLEGVPPESEKPVNPCP